MKVRKLVMSAWSQAEPRCCQHSPSLSLQPSQSHFQFHSQSQSYSQSHSVLLLLPGAHPARAPLAAPQCQASAARSLPPAAPTALLPLLLQGCRGPCRAHPDTAEDRCGPTGSLSLGAMFGVGQPWQCLCACALRHPECAKAEPVLRAGFETSQLTCLFFFPSLFSQRVPVQ